MQSSATGCLPALLVPLQPVPLHLLPLPLIAGMSVMEMSHRGKEFQSIIDNAEADLRALLARHRKESAAYDKQSRAAFANMFGRMAKLEAAMAADSAADPQLKELVAAVARLSEQVQALLRQANINLSAALEHQVSEHKAPTDATDATARLNIFF